MTENQAIPARFACLWLLLVCISPVAAREEITLTKILAEASESRRFESVASDELLAAEELFAQTLKSPDDASLLGKWHQLGWNLTTWRHGQETLFVLRESVDERHGRGLFAFRPSARWHVMVQAPHSFYDKHTRRIAIRLFEEGPFAAAAWNTVRRSSQDVAHSRGTYLNALTRAFLQVHTQGSIVQLHGFSSAKRQTVAGRKAGVIVSNGTRFPGRSARHVAAELVSSFDRSVLLYPTQVNELGGRTNTQADIVHAYGFDCFLHLELNPDIRQELRNRRDRREQFITSLSSSLKLD